MASTDAVMLGRAIAAARSAQGVKRRELAERAGVSYPYLSELENGTKQGSTQKIAAIADALGMTGSQLLAQAEALSGAVGAQVPDWGTDPGLNPLGGSRSSVEDALVPVIVAEVRREIDTWLDAELEPLVRRRVRAALPPE